MHRRVNQRVPRRVNRPGTGVRVYALAGLFALTLLGLARPAAGDTLESEHSLALGGHLGVVTGGGTSPGGLQVSGNLLYRLSRIDWFEGSLRTVIGGGAAACFTDRTGDFLCTHGPVAGRIGELSAGVRRYLLPQDAFTPYVQLRAGVRIATFPGDRLTGVAIPVLAGFGVHAQVSELIAVGGGASLETGLALYNREAGFQPIVALGIQIGVEFSLD